MSTLTVQNLPPVQHNGFRVITTEFLANVYETEINNIQQNFKRNKKRFIEGKHYFKIVGDALNNLRLTVSHLQISAKVRSLILWTERGAARHAKILDTDNAWDVFEALEDFYFAKKEDAQQKISLRQSTAKELTPLRQTAERLIATGVGNIYPDIWKYVHKEFGVEHINELLPEQIPQAISYLDALEGEYLPKQTEQFVNCRVLQHYDDKGAIVKFEIAADDEQLTSPKVFADLAESRGYVMVKKDDIYCDSTVSANVNAAYGNFKILKEIWYEKINPFLSTFSPEISSQVSGAMGNVDGPIYLAKLSLTPKLPA